MRRLRHTVAGLLVVSALVIIAVWMLFPRGLHRADVERIQVGMNPAEVAEELGRPPDRERVEDIKDNDPRLYMGHMSPPLFDRVDEWESESTMISVRYWRGKVIKADATGGGRWSEFVQWVRSGF